MPRLVLGSTSPYRRELLSRLGLPFTTARPNYAEASASASGSGPEAAKDLARENARGKARSLRADHPDALVLASDQVCECEGTFFGKPGTSAAARAQLARLQGKDHRLHTAVVLLDTSSGRIEEAVVTSPLRMRPLTEDEIAAYVAREAPLGSAGSYLSEGLGIALFESIGGDDPTAVIGLPLITVVRLLSRFGMNPLLAMEAR